MNTRCRSGLKLTISITALICSALIACSNLSLAAKPAHIQARLRLITREVSLGKIHPGEVQYSRVVSNDKKHVAYTVKTNNGEFVMLDGTAGKTYTSIPRNPLTEAGVEEQIKFSPDSQRLAYVARRGEKFLVVVDGKEGPEFDRIRIGAPKFSPDSRRVAYFAERGKKTVAVIDGTESQPFDNTHSVAPIFSPDSRRVVYVAEHGKQTHVVLDGVETVWPEYVGEPEFSKTGKRMVYVAVRQDKWIVVTDGKESKPYRDLGNNIEFSDDEQHVLYQADTDDGQMIVVDGIEMKPRPVIEENSYGFSPDGQRVAYVARDNRDIEYVVVDDKRGKVFEHVGKPTFSPDSRHVFYAGWSARLASVVTDGVEGEVFDEVNDYFQFSPDGRRMVYLAKRAGKEFLVVDGVASAYDEVFGFKFSPDSKRLFVTARNGNTVQMTLIGEPSKKFELTPGDDFDEDDFQTAFSPDSKQTAWVAKRGDKSFVVRDGVEGKPYDEIQDLQFTSDAKHIVYAAKRGGKLVVVVDDVESKWFDDFVSGAALVLNGARTAGLMVTRGPEILRVEIEIVD